MAESDISHVSADWRLLSPFIPQGLSRTFRLLSRRGKSTSLGEGGIKKSKSGPRRDRRRSLIFAKTKKNISVEFSPDKSLGFDIRSQTNGEETTDIKRRRNTVV